MNVDKLTDRDRDLLPEISALLKQILRGMPLTDLIEDVYFADAAIIAPLIRWLPNDQIRCLNISDTTDLTQIERLSILLAALKAITGDVRWIHWNIAKHLDTLWRTGLKCAKLPLLIHSMIAKANFADDPHGQTFVSAILAREFVGIAPRDAAINAIDACNGGDLAAFDYAKRASTSLGMTPPSPDDANITQLANISAHLRLGFSSIHKTIDSARSSIRSEIVKTGQNMRFPKAHGDTVHYVFRNAEKYIKTPEIELFTFENATISIDISRLGITSFYIFDDQGRCVTDLSRGFNPFISDDIETVSGSVAILDDNFSGSMNICHFLLDKLTRIYLYDLASEKPDWYLLADQYPYYIEALKRMGLADKVITPSKKRFSVKAEKLVVSSNIQESFRHPAHICAPWAIGFLQKSLDLPTIGDPRRKIFISRRDTEGRKIINEEPVLALLKKNGFEILTLSGMSLSDQIQLFAEASHVVAVHGAGLTNILFSNPECRVIEILPPLVATETYWLLANALGQRYSGLIAQDPEFPEPDYTNWVHNAQFNERDVIIPLDRLEALLQA